MRAMLSLGLTKMKRGRLNPTLGGPQEMNVVNEFGLYRLILRSNKPKAKAFQRWLIHDVLLSSAKLDGTKQANKSHSRK